MKICNILFLIFILQACDTPQRTRDPYSSTPIPIDSADTDKNVIDNNNDKDTNNTDTGSDSDTDDSETDTQTTGFENCNLGLQYYAKASGMIGLCQNSENETKFKLKMAVSDTTVGTCFVPININSNGASFKLGMAECVKNEANKEYTFTLSKERSEPINGVMVLKANAVNSYMQCMSAKVDFINAYAPNCMYDANCLAAADNYATGVCSQFGNTYENYFKKIPLPAITN